MDTKVYQPTEKEMRNRLIAAAHEANAEKANPLLSFEIANLMTLTGEPLTTAFKMLELRQTVQANGWLATAMPMAA